MKHKIKKKIKKWDKLFQKQTIVNNQHINIIFLGITFLTLALVQIITSAYSNTLEALPTWIYLVSQGTLILILLSIFVFILILNFGKIWKFFLSFLF